MEFTVDFYNCLPSIFSCMEKQNLSACNFILGGFNFSLDVVSAFSANFRKTEGDLTTMSAHHSSQLLHLQLLFIFYK